MVYEILHNAEAVCYIMLKGLIDLIVCVPSQTISISGREPVMFKTASGVDIPYLERIKEEYAVSENRIMFNISFEKIKPFILDFVSNLSEPLFFIIQKPLKEKYKPNSFTKGPFKAELLYFDLPTKTQILEVLDLYGEIILNDGMSQFGIQSHDTGDEIFFAKYKIAFIFSKDVEKHSFLLNKYGIRKTSHLITAWDVVSPDSPGKRSKVIVDNKDIIDVAEELKEVSLKYKSQIVDD